ncbi:hypothetical protein [Paraburkholderia bryophila]|uniref:Uncharacterized protein n=1 Tax=Paraburkholderia bryophila TaxID=420952 RepID=A0A7Y9W8M9_9BURK|nr:hypothetical protein [Paraburkholderia bryophila]NYH15676.1 hypothetical protein [Paraburkholderia bryophila]
MADVSKNKTTPRPVVISFVGYWILFQVLSVVATGFQALAGGYFGKVALYPGTSLSIPLQWCVQAAMTYGNYRIARALFAGDRRARLWYVGLSVLSAGLMFAFGSTLKFEFIVATCAFSVALMTTLFVGPGARYLESPGMIEAPFAAWKTPPVLLHIVASFGAYVVIMEVFSRQLPHTSTGWLGGPRPLMLVFAALLLLSHSLAPRTPALPRETGIVLVVWSGFSTYMFSASDWMSHALYPKMLINWDWSDVIPWLISAAAIGVGLLVSTWTRDGIPPEQPTF